MTTNPGFGKTQQKQKTQGAEKRATAAKQYDKLKSKGLPEFNIYIRIKDKKNWFPVGSLAVNRTSKINQAIFENEEELRKGAFRLFPVLRKNQNQLEYGYRLKEYNDEPIQLAEPPHLGSGNVIQSTVAQVTNRLSSLLRRG